MVGRREDEEEEGVAAAENEMVAPEKALTLEFTLSLHSPSDNGGAEEDNFI